MHDEQSIALARLTHRLPTEIDTMPYLDSLTMIAAHYESESAARKWQAALVGITLE